MPSWKKVIISGSNAELASLYAPSITGSLQGTSSFAVTASYATTSSLSLASTANQILVLNQAGYTISKGIVVHITGSNTASDIPRIVSASYESDLFSANTLGIASETITNGSTGYVTTEGVLTGINTIEFQSGQLVYLGATGSITGSAPLAPLHSVRLGQIVREQSNNGSIYVRIDNGYELGELHDVTDTTTTTSYGDLLVKSGSVWTNSRQLTGSYGITGSLIITGSTSTDLVRITQTGTGNAFVVEDSTNPDVTPFIITNTGRVGIGISSPTVQLDVSGSVEITETAAYIQDGSNVIYIAKGTDSFYANIVAGAGAGTNTQHRQTVFGYAAGATASGSNQSAFGYNAGYLNTGSRQTAFGALAGGYNKADYQTAAGYQAGFQNSGSNQTAFGYATGQYNSGSNQTAVGVAAGQYNSAASQTAIGVNAGLYNTGSFQTAVGVNAGTYNPSEYQSVFGRDAGINQTGSRQTAVGALAGGYNKADYQTAAGYQAGYLNVGLNQTAFGYVAGQTNSGSNQTAVGVHAGQSNSGSFQTAVGANAGRYNTASFQTAIGGMAGYQNAGSNQTAVGVNAGAYNSGSNNTNIGVNAGYYITGTLINSQSAESVFLGSSTFAGVANATNQIVIGYNATGIGSNSVVLGNSSIQTTALRGFVGIGITTPTASLHVNNTTTSASFLVEDSTNPDTTPFIIDTAGNVGIGTTTPSHKLHLYNNAYTLLLLERSGSLNAPIQYTNSVGTFYAGISSNGKFTIGGNPDLTVEASAHLNVLPAGNVGIGTTTPLANLHVTGSAIISGSLTVGSGSIGATENTLILGVPPARGTGEGGQLLLSAAGGTYTSASMIDNYQNRFRILRGTNASSDAEYFNLNLHSGQVTFNKYTGSGAFSGTAAGYLAFDSAGNILTTAGVAAGAAGNNTEIQYNNAGALAGTSAITFDGTTLRATGSFTGSLIGALTGTASFAVSASRAITASFALTSSFITASGVFGPYGSNSVISSSFAVTASNAITASYFNATIQTLGTSIYSTNPSTTGFNTTNGIYIGDSAGANSTNSTYSNFIGWYAGQTATNANESNFIGIAAGTFATDAKYSNFIGGYAGNTAPNASGSNFIGYESGYGASNAAFSNFFGRQTGLGASNASYSNLFGYKVASDVTGTVSIGPNNIIIGTNITLPVNVSDSINIGGIIFGTGSYSNLETDPYSGSVSNGRIGIGTTSPNATLDVNGNLFVANGITGSFTGSLVGALTGTASFAVSSSYATSASISQDTINKSVYTVGILSGSANWGQSGDGTITLPTVLATLYDNAQYSGSAKIYTITGGISGAGGLSALTNNDTNYILIDYNSGTPTYSISTTDTSNDSNIALAYIVYRLNNFVHVLDFGDQGSGLPNKINRRLEKTQRFARESGLTLSLSGSTGIAIIDSGVAWNGTNRQIIDQVNSSGSIFFKNYHSAGSWTTSTNQDYINNSYYDNGTDLTAVSFGKYLTNWYYRGQETNGHIYEVISSDQYDTVALAQLATEPSLPELVSSHAVLVGRIIVQSGSYSGLVESAFTSVFQATNVTSHNDLTAKQGGAANEYYHLTATQYNNIALTNTTNIFTADQIITGSLTVTGSYNSPSGNTIDSNALIQASLLYLSNNF